MQELRADLEALMRSETGYRKVRVISEAGRKSASATIEFRTADQAERIVTHLLSVLVPHGPSEHNCYKISKIVDLGQNVTVRCNHLYVRLAIAGKL